MVGRFVPDRVGQFLFHPALLLVQDDPAGHFDRDTLWLDAQIGGEDGPGGLAAIEQRGLLAVGKFHLRGNLLEDQAGAGLAVGGQLDVVGRQDHHRRRSGRTGPRLWQRNGQRSGSCGDRPPRADLQLDVPAGRLQQGNREHLRVAHRDPVDGHQVVRPHLVQLPARQSHVQREDLCTANRILQRCLQLHLVGVHHQQVLRLDADAGFLGDQPGGQGVGLCEVFETGDHVFVPQGLGQLVDLTDPAAGTPQNLPVARRRHRDVSPLTCRADDLETGQLEPLARFRHVVRPRGGQANLDRTRRLLRQPDLDQTLGRFGRFGLLVRADLGDRVAGGTAGNQLRAGRKTNAEPIERAAVTANRKGRFGVDAAAVDSRQSGPPRFQHRGNLGDPGARLAPR